MTDPKRLYHHISEEQLKKYLNGELKGEEAHEVERLMLDSPLDADALEGWANYSVDLLESDISDLREKFLKKKEVSKARGWQIAASISLLAAIGISIWFYGTTNQDTGQLAENLPKKESPLQKIEEGLPDETSNLKLDDQKPTEQPIPEHHPVAKKAPTATQPIAQSDISEVESHEEQDIPVIVPTEKKETSLLAESTFDLDKELYSVEATFDEMEDAKEETLMPVEDPIFQSKSVARSAISYSKPMPAAAPLNADPLAEESTNTRKISGIVLEEGDDIGIPGVNVIIKGTTAGTVTDLEGKFELELTAPESEELIFNFIGFETLVLPIQDTVTAIMSTDVEALSEVVVTAFGTADETPLSYQPALPFTGKRAYKKYLEENLSYPEAAAKAGISGAVRLQLTIDASGAIDTINVVKGLGYGCDEEAIRLVQNGPKWYPAEKDGRTVSDKVIVKVRFD